MLLLVALIAYAIPKKSVLKELNKTKSHMKSTIFDAPRVPSQIDNGEFAADGMTRIIDKQIESDCKKNGFMGWLAQLITTLRTYLRRSHLMVPAIIGFGSGPLDRMIFTISEVL